MADIKISALPVPLTLPVPGSALYEAVIAGVNYKVRGDQLSPNDGTLYAVPSVGSADVTVALQASITAAQAAGVPLKLPAGTYHITPAVGGGLVITAPLTILADPKAIIIAPAGSVAGVDMVDINSSNVTIEGGTWDWNNKSASAAAAIFNAVSGALSNIKIRNATIQNANWNCVNLQEVSNVEISGNTFINNVGGDIGVTCAGFDVANIRCHHNLHICPASAWEAVNIVNLSGGTKTLGNMKVTNNVILGSSAPTVGSCAIQIWANASNYNPGPLVIADNIIFGFAIGISAAFCTDGSVTGNVVTASSLIGYEMAGTGIICSGNVCEGNNITQYAFTSDGANRVCFSGNTARNFTLYGYSCTNNGSDNALFTGCHAYNSAAVGNYAAFAAFGVNAVTIVGCHVDFAASTSSGSLCAYIVDVGGLTITGCSFNIGTGGTFGAVGVDNSLGTRNNIKIKSNTFLGTKPTNGWVQLLGTSYGSNVDVEGMNSGALTQATSKSTALASGANVFQIDITMNAAALAAGAIASFNWPNTFVTANDNLDVKHISGGTMGAYALNGRCGAGAATIDVRNGTAGSLPEAIVLRATLTKSKAV